ncbi:hypothetical protein [Aeromicrobium sp. Sec7.5]|uniref:hypothetical protein n=1 Tax=Aeromicrobium sp. Sec7.5 TaxID=3121276 RepID=UPI002FE44605
MPRAPRIPDHLRHRPFTRSEALEAGMTSRQLQGRELRRLHPGVWVWTRHELTHGDEIAAARLAVPNRSRVSHLTRIHQLGLDHGPPRPIHLSIVGDHHLDLQGVFLHRTEVMPPCDEVGVIGSAAFLGYAASARVIDLIVAGDWLLHHGHMTLAGLRELAWRDRWRPGAREALWVAPYLDGGARSPGESETRVFLQFAGLPRPHVNVRLADEPHAPTSDLWLPEWRTAVEYEGSQHFLDPDQIRRDIGRYAWMRSRDIAYLQVTGAMRAQPRAMVVSAHALLVERGYRGNPPGFGPMWRLLFGRCPRKAVSWQPHPDLERLPAHRPSA